MTTQAFPEACVALDLETTGLQPNADEIIEIGAVLFQGEQTLASFHQMVDPRRPLPSFVSLLTGITTADLEGAPRFDAVAESLTAFLGDHAVVGHNVSFDLAFLAAKGVRPRGPVYDTRDLSRLLRPEETDHGLAALVAAFGVTNASPHRALADAEATMRVFRALWGRLMVLGPETLATARALSLRAGPAWPAGRLVQEAARLREVAPGTARDLVRAVLGRLGPPKAAGPLLRPRLVREAIQPDAIASFFGAEGTLARTMPTYEPRPQQATMAIRVAQALDRGETLLVEAPAGTGKSLAYLVPALAFARANHTPVAISTSTKGLQEQLATKDLPNARLALGLRPDEAATAVLNGRGNYICLARLAKEMEQPDLPPEEVPFLVRLLVWLESTTRGDMGEMALGQEEPAWWATLSAEAEDHASCPYQREGTCFLARARREAQGALLIITNHALLLADSVREGGALAHVKHLVIDEAHQLEREATEQYGRRATQREVEELFVTLGAGTGRPRLLAGALARAAAAGAGARLEGMAQRGADVGTAAATGLRHARVFYQRVGDLAARNREGVAEAELRCRFTAALRESQEWQPVGQAWEELDLSLAEVGRALGSLRDAVEGAAGPEAVHEVDDHLRRLRDLRARLEMVIAEPGSQGISWVSRPAEGRYGLILHWAPLSTASLLRSGLFQGREAIVLTSATLAAAGSFSYIRDRLGLEKAGELLLDSPFDYSSAAAVFVPSNMPEPDASGYARAVERALAGLAPVAGGGLLALFTSNSALRQAYMALRPALQAQGIPVVAQGIDGPAARLAELLRRQPRTILLGTGTFWEGVDLAGAALRLLVIVRLPFAVPSDPVVAARSETYVDPFTQFTLPETLLRFRQGAGRLIRSGRDQGAIVILDARVLTRGYGAAFLEALPPTSLSTPSLADLPHEVGAWLQGGVAASKGK